MKTNLTGRGNSLYIDMYLSSETNLGSMGRINIYFTPVVYIYQGISGKKKPILISLIPAKFILESFYR